MADDFDVVSFPDEFTIVDNSDDWVIYTTTETQYTLVFQSVALNDAAAVASALVQADADVVLTHADVATTNFNVSLTNADVTVTHADVVLTHADVTLTHADVTLIHADVVQTGLDATATAADRVQTGLDATATAADRVQTGLDRVATAADRVQTGLDRVATGADRVQTGADAANITAMIADLAGGGTGDSLVKQSNADYDFTWGVAGGGMSPLVYDPTNIHADMFARANHTGTQLAATISDFSTAADARVSAAIGVTVQAYSAVLAATTASYTVALNTKLNGIATGATANSTDATLLARANHTGTQLASTISNFATSVDTEMPVYMHGVAAKASPADLDEFPLVDSAASFALKKWTWANLKAAVVAYFNSNTTVPIDADRVYQGDSGAAFVPKYSTWTQVKAFLKTYFDTLYVVLSVINTWTARQVFAANATGNSGMATATTNLGEAWVQGNGTGAAMVAFHRPSSYAAYFGLDTDNVWKVGGWSAGAVAYKLWHAGNDGAGSGLDADLLDGLNANAANAASTIASRDGSGDIVTRLFRTEWNGGGWNGLYVVGMNANGGAGADNYMRPAATTTAVAVGMAGLGTGALGTFGLFQRNVGTAAYGPGATIAGSSLAYSTVGSNVNGVPTGTWQCCGNVQGGSTSSGAVTVWLRIA